MNSAKQICALCSDHFSTSNLAWIISFCGHNICSQCLRKCKASMAKSIACKQCKCKYNVDQEILDQFPKNISILKSLRDSNNNSMAEDNSKATGESSMLLSSASLKLAVNKCPKHDKPLEIICTVDRGLLCAHCAIFGQHQNHTFKTLEEFDAELKDLKTYFKQTELQKQICDESLRSKKYKSSLVTKISTLKDKLAMEIRDRFTRLSVLLKDAESKTLEELLRVIKSVDSEISKLTKQEKECQKEYIRWKKDICEFIGSLEQVTDTKSRVQIFYGVNRPSVQDGRIYMKELERNVASIKEVIEDKIKSIAVEYAPAMEGTIYNYATVLVNPNQLRIKLEEKLKSFDKGGEMEMFKDFQGIKNRREMKMQFVKSTEMSDLAQLKQKEPNFRKQQSGKASRNNLYKVKSNPKMPKALLQKLDTPKKPLTPPKHQAKAEHSKHEENLQHAERMLNQFISSSDTLDLTSCELNDDQLVHLVGEAGQHKPIKCLKLCKNKLTNHGLGQMIQHMGSITNINLSYNGLTDECVDIFVDKREHLPCLRIINLAHNKVNERKVKSKLEELKKVGVITTL